MNIFHNIYMSLQKNKCYFCNKLMNDIANAFDKNIVKKSDHFILTHNSGYCDCGLNYMSISRFDQDNSSLKFSYPLNSLNIYVVCEQYDMLNYQYFIGLYDSEEEEYIGFEYEFNSKNNKFTIHEMFEIKDRDQRFLYAKTKEELLTLEHEILKETVFS